MKLRRALATAAATAVIGPVALLAAPAAYATDGDQTPPTSSATTAETATAEPTPAEDTSPEESTQSEEPSAPESSPAEEPSAPESSPAEPTDEPSSSAPAEPTEAPSEGPVECNDSDEEPQFDDNLVTGFSGLPSKIVAGSGYHNFKLNVSNTSDASYQRVDLGVFTAQLDEESWNISTSHLTLQFQNPETGAWTNISLDENDEGAGYVGYTDVRPHESFSLNLRLSVDASAPAGLGFAISIGVYANDKGDCVYSGGDSYYEFDILKAGSKPGEVPGAKPQGGKKPLPAKPSGNTEINPKGNLAKTGSSSMLPTIATIGGVAMVVGAGAVFVVRRRKSAGSEAAA